MQMLLLVLQRQQKENLTVLFTELKWIHTIPTNMKFSQQRRVTGFVGRNCCWNDNVQDENRTVKADEVKESLHV